MKDLCVLRPRGLMGLAGGIAKEIMTGQTRLNVASPRSREKSAESTFESTRQPFFNVRIPMTDTLYASSIPLFKQSYLANYGPTQ